MNTPEEMFPLDAEGVPATPATSTPPNAPGPPDADPLKDNPLPGIPDIVAQVLENKRAFADLYVQIEKNILDFGASFADLRAITQARSHDFEKRLHSLERDLGSDPTAAHPAGATVDAIDLKTAIYNGHLAHARASMRLIDLIQQNHRDTQTQFARLSDRVHALERQVPGPEGT